MDRELRIVREVARGGMATVYEAIWTGDFGFEQKYAVKIPHEGLLEDPRFLSLFVEEARNGAKLRHPRIAKVIAFEASEKVEARPRIVFEWVEGTPLRNLLQRNGGADDGLAASILTQVAEALRYAHTQGVAHGDLTPSNVLIDELGNVKVIDFGLSSLRTNPHRGGPFGTPAYLPPERLAGDRLSRTSDFFQFGLLVFEVFVGERWFESSSLEEQRVALRGYQTPTVEVLRRRDQRQSFSFPTLIEPQFREKFLGQLSQVLSARPEERESGFCGMFQSLRYLSRSLEFEPDNLRWCQLQDPRLVGSTGQLHSGLLETRTEAFVQPAIERLRRLRLMLATLRGTLKQSISEGIIHCLCFLLRNLVRLSRAPLLIAGLLIVARTVGRRFSIGP